MEELTRLSDIKQASADDGHLIWAAQGQTEHGLGPGVRAWRHGTAVAVASPCLSQRDRLAIAGDGPDAVVLGQRVLDEVGPSYRPFGEALLIDALVGEVPGLLPVPYFFWAETTALPGTADAGVWWLDAQQEQRAVSLFGRFFPDSYAQPGGLGVRRWAGASGEVAGAAGPGPLAVAADAWSAFGCGFVAGVVTHPAARGRGLAQAVCGFVVNSLVRHRGRAALMVDAGNAPAIATYERLGMVKRLFGAAHFAQP
ncbi:GNAT family N-acetyltransferase [Streptomyces nondiastaticus]|uniref:GNAT family N-acetyltransferase n=1 Tax=Streptomyces nondiastaticus TaxID=3154512 RepID=UPI0034349777